MSVTNETSSEAHQASPDEQALAVTEETESSIPVTVAAREVSSRLFQGSEFVLSSMSSPRGRRTLGWIALALIVVLVVSPISGMDPLSVNARHIDERHCTWPSR